MDDSVDMGEDRIARASYRWPRWLVWVSRARNCKKAPR